MFLMFFFIKRQNVRPRKIVRAWQGRNLSSPGLVLQLGIHGQDNEMPLIRRSIMLRRL